MFFSAAFRYDSAFPGFDARPVSTTWAGIDQWEIQCLNPMRNRLAGFFYWKRMEKSAITRPPRHHAILLSCLLLAVLVLVIAAEALRWRAAHGATTTVVAVPSLTTTSPGRVTLTELSHAHIPAPRGMPSAHASTLAALPGNRMLAFWWAGSRESGPDVKVFASTWAHGAWSATRMVASRDTLGAELGFGVRRIGNPVAWTDRTG